MSEKRAVALLSDVDKTNYKEENWYQISPLMFQKINEKIEARSGNVRTLLLYLIFQQQNGDFHPAETAICAACNMPHARYNEARKALVEKGFIEYEPYNYIKILYKNIMA
jgi:hypothetical protein